MSKNTEGKYTIHPIPSLSEYTIHPTPSLSASGFTVIKQSDGEDTYHIAEVYGSDKEAQNLATLFASAPILLAKLIKIKRDINLMQKGFLNSFNSEIVEDINEHCDIALAKAEGGAK